MTSDSTAARSRRYGARESSRIDDPVEYDEPTNEDPDDEYNDDDVVAVAAQVAATAAHASRTSRVARSSSIASGVVDPSPPPHRDPTEPGSERAAADEEDDDDPTRDARVSSRGPATAREVDSYSDERPRDKRIVDAAAFETMSGDWTITIARTASGSSPPLDSPSSSSPGTRTLRLRAPRRRWVAAGAVPGRTEAEGDARAFGSDGKARDVSTGSSTRGRLARHPIARARTARALDMGRPRER